QSQIRAPKNPISAARLFRIPFHRDHLVAQRNPALRHRFSHQSRSAADRNFHRSFPVNPNAAPTIRPPSATPEPKAFPATAPHRPAFPLDVPSIPDKSAAPAATPPESPDLGYTPDTFPFSKANCRSPNTESSTASARSHTSADSPGKPPRPEFPPTRTKATSS